MEIKIKRTYGKTWAGLQNKDFITPEFLNKIGEMLVEAIVFEAGKDFAKQGNKPTPPGEPEGLPRSVGFFDSFTHKVVPRGGRVEIYSSWPWIDQLLEGREAYPMEWLTQQAGVSRVPMKGPGGTVLIRTTPASPQDSWIHPGFKKHTFVRRAYEKSRRKMKAMIDQQIMKTLKETPLV